MFATKTNENAETII